MKSRRRSKKVAPTALAAKAKENEIHRKPSETLAYVVADRTARTCIRRHIADACKREIRNALARREPGKPKALTFDIDFTIVNHNDDTPHGFDAVKKVLVFARKEGVACFGITAREDSREMREATEKLLHGLGIRVKGLHLMPPEERDENLTAEEFEANVTKFKGRKYREVADGHDVVLRLGDKAWDVISGDEASISKPAMKLIMDAPNEKSWILRRTGKPTAYKLPGEK